MSREQRIYDALFVELKPEALIIENESHGHNVPAGSETHFKVVAVSKQFENLRPVARHRLVNRLLADEFSSGLHALSLHVYTPEEWQMRTANVPKSPACRNHKHGKE
jgi:BolA protein